MRKVKQLLVYHSNKGQIIFLIVSLILTLFVFLVIMLGNLSTSSFQFTYILRNFVNLRSLAISGLRYSLWQINQNPNFNTSSSTVMMPQGSFIYSVSNIDGLNKRIIIQANLNNSLLSKVLNATATISSTGTILNLEISEE